MWKCACWHFVKWKTVLQPRDLFPVALTWTSKWEKVKCLHAATTAEQVWSSQKENGVQVVCTNLPNQGLYGIMIWFPRCSIFRKAFDVQAVHMQRLNFEPTSCPLFFFFGRLYFKPLLQNFAPYVASSKSLLVTCFSAWTGTCRDRCLLSFEPLVFFYWLLLGCLWPKCHPPFVHTLDMHLA